MTQDQLRPWGPLTWLFPKLGVAADEWGLIGTCAIEDRSMAVLGALPDLGEKSVFVEIRDPELRDPTLVDDALSARRNQLIAGGVQPERIRRADLLAPLDDINGILELSLDSGLKSILLDISAMPKRWFLPLVRTLASEQKVENLVVTYASAGCYAEVLAENPMPIRMLPGFHSGGALDFESIIVGIGFEPLGLSSLFNELRPNRLRVLFPFPPGPPGFVRNWMFVRGMEESTNDQNITAPDSIHIDMYDCPGMFDTLHRMTRSDTRPSILAPYGPKTMSLAMGLFSIACSATGREVPIYYAQPSWYSPEYSKGIKQGIAGPEVHAYALKMDGRNLYELKQ